ncbi:hypothetical protein [Antarcticirhabdus aurantiaca]|uniref:Uncharacterized protein n=1 Tax=Antarcticirhabdus aurantiaca TaxID=2606717 RepID=A0ACD4NRA6_9HYPH|nr:hypothetical protein [Antarcticirhabdus aurantiaca]WAJ29445.1 hypothetical protein OXU80_04190 [Jeongeuplla avenae]
MTKDGILSTFGAGSSRVDADVRERSSPFPGMLRPAGRIDGIACRGARAMLGLSQTELCRLAECGRNLLNEFEGSGHVPRASSVARIRTALEMAGAIFLDAGDGTILVGVSGSSKPVAMGSPSAATEA